MLRILNALDSLPQQYQSDQNSTYHPGKFAQLNKQGEIVASDGFDILGIIDDIRTDRISYTCCKLVDNQEIDILNRKLDRISFFRIDEKEIDFTSLKKDNKIDLKYTIEADRIIIDRPDECQHLLACYSLSFVDKCDTTVGSNRVTVWQKPIVAQTDIFDFESLGFLKKYQTLYVKKGRLTAHKWSEHLKPAAILLDVLQPYMAIVLNFITL